MKSFPIIAFLLLLFSCSDKQNSEDKVTENIKGYRGSELEKIETSLIKGDKSALFRLAPFLDSTTKLVDNYIEAYITTPKKTIAQRLLSENCIFLRNELNPNDSTSAKQFKAFLRRHEADIKFDKDAAAFVITPLTGQNAIYKIRELIAQRKSDLQAESNKLLNSEWVKQNKIDTLIKSRNPNVLFEIAAAYYRDRERYHGDYGYYRKKEYIDLLENLTGVEIGVEDEHHKIDFHIEKNFYPTVRLNLLIYFAKNWNFYKWDNKLKVFRNKGSKIEPLDQETELFQLLASNINSIALNAYIKLTTCNPEKVAQIADEYDKADVRSNFNLPTSIYWTLEKIPFLTEYYKKKNIDFVGSDKLRKEINTLRKELGFRARRDLENKMIKDITFDDACALEYWSFIYDDDHYGLTFSTGRILDIYYSNNWDKLIADKKQLDAYLKKSFLFGRLGEKYLEKFIGADSSEISMIRRIKSDDKNIMVQSTYALAEALKKRTVPPVTKKINEGNYDASVTDLGNEFSGIVKSKLDPDKREEQIAILFSKINYEQIGQALRLIENIKFKWQWYKYSFIENDFGFFMDDFEDLSVRKAFLKYYDTHTEKEVYQNLLARAGIDYQNADQSLNYDKIYELLKYDVVNAIPRSAAGAQDNEVYALIKLLEIQFNTRLGFPKKLCNSRGAYKCDSADRVKLWMELLKDKKLLKLRHNTPLSFSYYDN